MVWSLSCGEAFLPDVSSDEIRKIMAKEPEAKPRLRLLIALKRKQNKSLDEISEACAVPRRTVHGTLQRFCERGLNAVHAAVKPGRPKRLTQKQVTGLRKRLLNSPQASGFREGFWTTRMILSLVKRLYGVSYTREHMTRVLSKIGFSYKKPRATNPRRASDEEVAEFKKKRVERCWLPHAKTA